jgi:hypothetical protein
VHVYPERLEATAMWNTTDRTDYLAGHRLLRQDYEATLADLKARQDVTATEQLRLRYELAEEYRMRRAQEMKAVRTQMKADAGIAR